MSLLSKPLVEFPFAAGNLKTSFEAKGRVVANSDYLYSVLRGRTNLIVLASQYANSYKNASIKTVLHYRDFFLSQALFESVVNCQYQDSNKTILTTHAERVWGTFSYDDIWPYINPTADTHTKPLKYADLLGSPAYFLSRISTDSFFPQDILKALIKVIWQLVGFSSDLSVRERLRRLIIALRLDSPLIEQLGLPVNTNITPVISQMRRAGASFDQIPNLRLKLLLNEYRESTLSPRFALFGERDRNTLREILFGITSLLKPGGFPLLLQTLAVESFYSAAEVLQAVPQEALRLSINDFRSLDEFSSYSTLVVEALALAYDAYSLLSAFNTFIDAEKKKKSVESLISYWLSSSETDAVPGNGNNRISLGTAYTAKDISLTDLRFESDSFFSTLEEQPPKGSVDEVIILKLLEKSNTTITLQTTDIFGNPTPASLFNLYNTGLGTFLQSQPNESTFVIETEGTGGAALVAVPVGTTNIDLDSYLSNSVVASNPITVSSDPLFTPVSDITDDPVSSTVDNYNIALSLQELSTPYGSNNDIYRSRGVPVPRDTDYRNIISSSRNLIYGARTENTSRMVGLVEAQLEHETGAVDTALAWAQQLEEL
jgi:hypothetical protein